MALSVGKELILKVSRDRDFKAFHASLLELLNKSVVKEVVWEREKYLPKSYNSEFKQKDTHYKLYRLCYKTQKRLHLVLRFSVFLRISCDS